MNLYWERRRHPSGKACRRQRLPTAAHRVDWPLCRKRWLRLNRPKGCCRWVRHSGRMKMLLWSNTIKRQWRSLCTKKDQLDEARVSAAEARRNMAALSERVQSLQSELNHSELRREELQTELSNTQEVRRFMCVWLSACLLGIRFSFQK